jgi:nucleoside-diphosphate-sugar epimerase
VSDRVCMVLGGKGFVGSAIVREAESRGYKVLNTGRDEYDECKGKRCDLLINANGNSRKYLAKENPLLDFEMSVESVIRSCIDFKPRQYVYLSSSDVYPCVSDPDRNKEDTVINTAKISTYGLHKFMAEQAVCHYHPHALILRMGGLIGPGLWKNPIFDLWSQKPLRVHPDSAYSYISTADLARALFTLLDIPRESFHIFNVAGKGRVSLRKIASMIPHAKLPDKSELNQEQYEISTEKLSTYWPVPCSLNSVEEFIKDALAGRVHFADKPT